MAVQRPAPEDLTELAHQFHFSISQERMPAFEALVEGFLAPYDRLDELEEPKRQPRYPRDGGAAPRRPRLTLRARHQPARRAPSR
jgi:hypothetical protein